MVPRDYRQLFEIMGSQYVVRERKKDDDGVYKCLGLG